MFFQTGKSIIFAFLLGLILAGFSIIISAQTKNPEQNADINAQIKSVPTESKITSETSNDSNSPNLNNLQKEVQTEDLSVKKVDSAQKTVEKNVRFGEFTKTEKSDSVERFVSNVERERQNKLKLLTKDGDKLLISPITSGLSNDADNAPPEKGFQWRSAIRQSLIFLAVQHGYAFTQPKTREALKGKFFKDYAESVKSLRGWDDGGKFFTNYVAHPMQGAFTGFIYVQNDPKAKRQQFGLSGDYWRSRLKALAWTTAWSTQFEIGPLSQASIGNVGLKGKQTWEDILVTPTLGTAMLVTEDALDRFVVQRIERKTDNFYIKIFSRMLLSPTRIFANLLRLKAPWYRDRPTAH